MSTTKWDGLTGRARQLRPQLITAYQGGPEDLEWLLICTKFTPLEFYALATLKINGFTLQRLLNAPEHELRRYLTKEEALKVKWALFELGLGIGLPRAFIKEFGQRLAS